MAIFMWLPGYFLVENSGTGSEELLKSLQHTHVPLIEYYGPPGGKSTLTDALIKQFIEDGKEACNPVH
jgi:putative protein kinase ArgK-like GTPase of G3E family